jgi:hypothetical protein
MRIKIKTIIASVVVLANFMYVTAYADESAPQTNSTGPISPAKKGAFRTLFGMPKTIAGVCSGIVIGTPVCFIKKLPQETLEGGRGFVGSIIPNENNKLLLIPACAAWLPVATVMAAIESPGYALRDSWMAEKPFSKEQFSLTELDK